MSKIHTRMGDGSAVMLSKEEIRADLEEGTRDAADRGKIPPLTEDELEKLLDICTSPEKLLSVERGSEIVTTCDSGASKITYHANIPMDRTTAIQTAERVLCSDTTELGNIDYSYKQVKPILHDERVIMEYAQMNTIIPLFYGAMPNLGLYTKPDGPTENWSELLPKAMIREAREAQEEAVEYAVKDIVYVAGGMYESGADGINVDTVGAAGDADVLASLQAVELIREEYPDLAINIGMAGEFILGMHGELKYKGSRLAGLYPHDQVKLAEQAGATIFGPVVNTNSNRSFPWNLARACTFVKACTEAASIPVHVNVGMGVGAIPLSLTPPVDAVCRADKALIEIGKADGL